MNHMNTEIPYMTDSEYYMKLRGAIIGRFTGCALGAPVELLDFNVLEDYAKKLGISYPPVNYWPDSPKADVPRYINGFNRDFTLPYMKFLPADDDILYTILTLLILEEYGTDFTTSDVAKAWLEYLPEECTFTAERITLRNLKNGILAKNAGEYNNPDMFMISAVTC